MSDAWSGVLLWQTWNLQTHAFSQSPRHSPASVTLPDSCSILTLHNWSSITIIWSHNIISDGDLRMMNQSDQMTNLTFLEIFRTWMMRFSQTVSHYCSQSQVCDTVSSSPDQGALSSVSSLTDTASLCPGHSPPAVLILSWISLLTQARLVFLSLTSPRQHVTL